MLVLRPSTWWSARKWFNGVKVELAASSLKVHTFKLWRKLSQLSCYFDTKGPRNFLAGAVFVLFDRIIWAAIWQTADGIINGIQ